MQLKELESYLNDVLRTKDFSDYCPKGVVIEASENIKKGIAAVSFCAEVVEYAITEKADFILVHHPDGFFNNQPKILTGRLGKLVKAMMQNNISLIGYHLPLDAHEEFGNNAQIAKVLGMKVVKGFANDGSGNFIGCVAEFDEAKRSEDFFELYKDKIGPILHKFAYGEEPIKSIAICSGSAGHTAIEEAQEAGAQCLITGEAKESSMAVAKELGMHFIAGGHHRTEIWGVKALAKLLESEKSLEMKFLDVKNPV